MKYRIGDEVLLQKNSNDVFWRPHKWKYHLTKAIIIELFDNNYKIEYFDGMIGTLDDEWIFNIKCPKYLK